MSNCAAQSIWEKVLELLKNELNEVTLSAFFSDLVPVELEQNCLVVCIPSQVNRQIVSGNYLGHIQRALKELLSVDMDVTILSQEEADARSRPKSEPLIPGADDYTFDRFVVGPSNKFAHAAAQAVAEKPAQSYNPLLIYGKSGLGKTHLLHSIAHTIRTAHPDYRIVYIKGDDLTNELVHALREGRNREFRQKYRDADVFLMDDVQFIAGKDSTQEEFFHIFNTLYEAKRQIVLTSDRPPKEMLLLEDRLRTRFEWGLLADIQPPDYETRMAIIKNKSIRMGLELPDFCLEMIAENITSNVRQIEGTINKIMAYQQLNDTGVDKDTVARVVTEMFKQKDEIMPTPDVILDEVSKFFNVEAKQLKGQSRTKDISLARQVAMYLIQTMVRISSKEIGRFFDNRDHTTVLYATERITKMVKERPEMAELIHDVTANINARYE